MVIERQEDIEKRKKTALFAVFIVLCITVLLLFLLSLEYRDPPLVDMETPVEVEIQTAGGDPGGSTSAGDPEKVSSSPNPTPAPPSESVMTSTEPSDDQVQSSASTSTTQSDGNPSEETGRFSFGGMSGSGSSGSGSGTGDGDSEGTGSGVSGSGPGVKGLSGGRVVHKIPPFDWERVDGYINIQIVFKPDGTAKSATYTGGTISDKRLQEKCRQEAMKAKATPISGSQLEKYTYRFNFTSS